MKQTIIAASLFAAVTLSGQAATSLSYALGENDPGAADGVALNATTVGSGGLDLSLTGNAGTYSSSAAPGGSTLAASFSGTEIYGGNGFGFYDALDLNNFAFGFDAFPTASPSFHIAMTVGSNSTPDGEGGNVFIYHTGGQWNAHSNGIGDIIAGPAGSAVLNTWQNVRFERVDGVGTLYIDGLAVGSTTTAFPAAGLKDALSIGGNRNNSVAGFEGGFIGRIDNAYVVPEPSTALLAGLAGVALMRRRRA